MAKKQQPPPLSTNKDDTATAMKKNPSSRNPPPTTAATAAAAASTAVETAKVDDCEGAAAASAAASSSSSSSSPPVSSYSAAIEQYWRSEFDSKSTELKMEHETTTSLPSSLIAETSEKAETKMPPTQKLSPEASSKKPSLPPQTTSTTKDRNYKVDYISFAAKATSDKCTSKIINSSSEDDKKAKSVSNLGPTPNTSSTTTTNTKVRSAESDALMYVLEDFLEEDQGHQAVICSDGKKGKNDYVRYHNKENNHMSYPCNNTGQANTL